ncbi:MAG: DUF4293 domain-containing protein [Bacteroides sp.]
MIQRIQTIYLLLVVGLLITTMCLSVGSFVGTDGSVAEFTNLSINIANATPDNSPWGMFAILMLSTIISFASILLFKNRMLQIRMTVFNTVLLIGYYITFIVFMFILQSRLHASFQLAFGLALPLIAIIFNYLAIRAIAKDEVMVRASERLR